MCRPNDFPPYEETDWTGTEDYYSMIKKGLEMREENFGPVANPDGSPTEFTKQMFGITDTDEGVRPGFHESIVAPGNTYSTTEIKQMANEMYSIQGNVEDSLNLLEDELNPFEYEIAEEYLYNKHPGG